ncbi:MAG TPA: PP2C family protein-serine/threonine phosphatase [Chlamydiales bacterium]|nr:PP2C family protein-serine/threonine phosphatase [Chlamydiales bacterium]
MVSTCCSRIAKSCFPTSLFTPGCTRIAKSLFIASSFGLAAFGWTAHLMVNHLAKRNIFVPQNASIAASTIAAIGVVALLADRLICSSLKPRKPVLSLSQRIASFHEQLKSKTDEQILDIMCQCNDTLVALQREFSRLPTKGKKESELLASIVATLARVTKNAPPLFLRIRALFRELTEGNTKLPANVLKNFDKYKQRASQLAAEFKAVAKKDPNDAERLERIRDILEFHKKKPTVAAPKKPSCCTSFFRYFWFAPKHKSKMDAWTREHRPYCTTLKGAQKRNQQSLERAALADANDKKENHVVFIASRAAAESAIASTRSIFKEGQRNILVPISKITTKDCPVCPDKERFQYAAATHMGSKEGNNGYYNEDRIFAYRGFVVLGKYKYPFRMWGVCDGHSQGDAAAEFVKQNILECFKKNLKAEAKKCCSYKKLTNLEINNAINRTALELNDRLYARGETTGTTLNFSIAMNHTLFNANVGDTRAILVRNGKLTPMSRDHKPKEERASLEARGGAYDPVENRACRVKDNKFWGDLAPGRTIGDGNMDRRISSRPTITAMPADKIDEGSFVMIASDGAWDYAPSSVYSNGLFQYAKNTLQDLAYQVVGSAVVGQFKATVNRPDGSRCDNTSAIIVRFPKYDRRDYDPQPA